MRVRPRERKASVHLRVDADVLDWFKSQGAGHLTRMNAVLRAYMQARKAKPTRSAAKARALNPKAVRPKPKSGSNRCSTNSRTTFRR